MNERKILTVPSEKVNFECDNVEFDLVVARGDYLSKSERQKYMVIDMLGKGTFGQVLRCIASDGEEVAIKVIKSLPKYYNYGMNEVRILHKLLYNGLTSRFVRIKDVFMFKHHLCIVEELLGICLYTFLKRTMFRGIEHAALKPILLQILEGMSGLSLLGIIHCDLKPENILISDYDTFGVKIIDFGSAVTTPQDSNFYVQSRYYRAPEIILGIPYGSSCDLWSFGCIAYEMYVGRPLFPGENNIDQIGRIYGFFGSLPIFMLEHGKNSSLFFEKENEYRLIKPSQSFTLENMKATVRSKNGDATDDKAFLDFLLKILEPSPLARRNARALMNHVYFKSAKPIHKTDRKEDVKRGVKQEIPSTRRTLRHMSTSGASVIEKEPKSVNDRRKTSVYDTSYENNAEKKEK